MKKVARIDIFMIIAIVIKFINASIYHLLLLGVATPKYVIGNAIDSFVFE